MNAIIDVLLIWSPKILAAILALYFWRNCHRYGWPVLAGFLTLILACFAMAFGEGYYLTTNALPWFFGLEKNFAKLENANAAFFLAFLGIVTWWIAVFILPKIATWWSKMKYLPGNITPTSISAIGLLLFLFISANASANLCKAKGFTWGLSAVSFGGNIGGDAADLFQDQNHDLQEQIGELQAKTPARPNRN